MYRVLFRLRAANKSLGRVDEEEHDEELSYLFPRSNQSKNYNINVVQMKRIQINATVNAIDKRRGSGEEWKSA